MSRSKHSRTRDGGTGHDAGVAMAAQASHAVDEARVQAASLNEKEVAGLDGRPASPVDDELWSVKTVLTRTALSRSSIYSYVELGLFPRQRIARQFGNRVGCAASSWHTAHERGLYCQGRLRAFRKAL